MNKKEEQLGMNPSTANGRLQKDILWHLVQKCGLEKCHRCGEIMNRETFSIDHITPWLDSESPVDSFFDISNIAFSHLSCNVAVARKPHKIYESVKARKKAEWKRYWDKMGKEKQQQRRRRNYEKYDC